MSTSSGNGLVPPGNESLLGPVLTMIPDVIQVITAHGCIKGRTNRKSGMEKTNGDNEDFISHDDIIKWKLFRVTGLLWGEAGNIMVYRNHYSDVIMGVMASQITSLTIVYSTVYSGADQRRHQSSASLAFVRGIHRWPVNSPHEGPVTRNMVPFDDIIIWSRIRVQIRSFLSRRSSNVDNSFDKRLLLITNLANAWPQSFFIASGLGQENKPKAHGRTIRA